MKCYKGNRSVIVGLHPGKHRRNGVSNGNKTGQDA